MLIGGILLFTFNCSSLSCTFILKSPLGTNKVYMYVLKETTMLQGERMWDGQMPRGNYMEG